MKNGDLLFISDRSNLFSKLIIKSTSEVFSYNHVAILYIDYDNNFNVIESIPSRGVIKRSLAEFITDNVEYEIDLYRVKIKFNDKEVIKNAFKFLGEPYNNTFTQNGNGLYCSELIIKSFANENIFKPIKLQFGKDKETLDSWTKYYEEYNMKIPFNDLGSSPNSLIKSDAIRFVENINKKATH
ncbi:hypothetical protein GSH19_06300 [Lactobacillus sp. S2-2]|uniref:YiiX/YebB-like N1pC/P60 family cysteine hydrolase n=1 Tax=Lactobacillus sp. S2-2 TaxID=2692917 RepID=UPI001F40E0DA|nr:YiiX/YebB-like N1pC/P60 family cysteine hydrolase [Lactobacillus sp. S2-2]MCF6515755.1 hypothetical protein [Lactobacillus sp. S2-2]